MKSLASSPLLAPAVGNVRTSVARLDAQVVNNSRAAFLAFDFWLNADEGLFSIDG